MKAEDWRKTLKILGKEAEKEARRTPAKTPEPPPDLDFAQTMQGVKPLKSSHRIARPPERSPIPLRRDAACEDEYESIFVGESDFERPAPRQYSRGGEGKNAIRRLSGRDCEPVATLDLHGYRCEEAQKVLNEFVAFVQKRGTVAEIIHGSGLNSHGFEPRLKQLTRRWLTEHPQVLAYVEPDRNDGAVRVLFKSRKKREDEKA